MLGVFIAVLSGALMSIQGVFNAELTKQSGIWMAAGFVQISAFFVCLAAWFMTGSQSSVSELFSIDKKYMLLGGVMGAFITYTVIKGIEYLGPARNAQLIIISQLIVAYLIEVMGLFGSEKTGFDIKKVIGVLVITSGIVIFTWGH